MGLLELLFLFAILLVGLPIVVGLCLITWSYIKKIYFKKIYEYAKNSAKIKELKELSLNHIHSLPISEKEYSLINKTIYAKVSTLSALKNYDYEWDLWNEVWNKKDTYSNLILLFPMVKLKDGNYHKKYDEILYKKNKYFKSRVRNNIVYKYELKIGNSLRMEKLPDDIFLKLVVIYKSPKGRNRETREKIIYGKTINYYCTHKIQRKRYIYQDDIQAERGKMNESLRYDVFKRDGFKCCICGATAKDGAKLHVDHIIPVSKGGKTVKENLQTLCEKCNRGKSNKI